MLNDRQNQIFIGSMLGDGCVVKNFSNGGVCRLQNCQSIHDHQGCDKKTYMQWLAKEFFEYDSEVSKQTVRGFDIIIEGTKITNVPNNKEHERYLFYVKNLKLWELLEKK